MPNCDDHGTYLGHQCPTCEPLLCANCGEPVAHAPVEYKESEHFTFVVWHTETGDMKCELQAELPEGYDEEDEDDDRS